MTTLVYPLGLLQQSRRFQYLCRTEGAGTLRIFQEFPAGNCAVSRQGRESELAKDIDRKLRLTAAFLGVVARKDLAAAFRRVNANTSFEIGRADKWLQGRAQPRELQIYEDWSRLLELDLPGQWIADCDTDAFLEAICVRHSRDREVLLRALETPANRTSSIMPGSTLELAGTFVGYSHAWSPYFRGRLIRGVLSISGDPSSNRLSAAYTEVLPTGVMELKGPMSVAKRALHVQVSDAKAEAQVITLCLFQASPPASVLAGLMFGTTVIGPDAQPSVTRIVLVRVPAAVERLRVADAYLPTQGSITEDLATFGLRVENPAATDQLITQFLTGANGGFDQIPVSAYRALADTFDRCWLSAMR
jgi:hypothetical protein